ncbi:MAG: type II toxin-antitoxin system RelE/ParE family toxin [Burkholderiaceae bacterium]
MRLQWTASALADITRLYDFLTPFNQAAAARTVQSLTAAPSKLLQSPYIGKPLAEFAPREVRRLIVGQYELRYEITETTIFILRLWHTREDR